MVCSAWRSSLWVDAAAPDAGVAKEGRASGPSRTGVWGNRRVAFSRCTAAGAGWRSVCSSCCAAAARVPVPLGRGVHGCKRASSVRIPKEWHGRWGAGGSGGGGPLRPTFEARRLGGRDGGGKGGLFKAPVFLTFPLGRGGVPHTTAPAAPTPSTLSFTQSRVSRGSSADCGSRGPSTEA